MLIVEGRPCKIRFELSNPSGCCDAHLRIAQMGPMWTLPGETHQRRATIATGAEPEALLVEQRAHNPQAAGSNPAWFIFSLAKSAWSSHHLDAAGWSHGARTIKGAYHANHQTAAHQSRKGHSPSRPSGATRPWQSHAMSIGQHQGQAVGHAWPFLVFRPTQKQYKHPKRRFFCASRLIRGWSSWHGRWALNPQTQVRFLALDLSLQNGCMSSRVSSR